MNAKKYVFVDGLSNVLEYNSQAKSYLISADVEIANNNSILFIKTNEADTIYGFAPGEKYMWVKNKLYNCNDKGFTYGRIG